MAIGPAKSIGRKIVRAVDSLVNLVVLTIILLLAAIAAYAIWDANQVFNAANADKYEIYKPSAENNISFEELRAINPEVFAWLTLYDTNIDYPVTQAKDNAKYVNTNAFGEYSLSGAIFLDCANDKSFQDFNSILYGHHMEKQTMFGELGYFSEKSYFESHRYGNLFFDGKDHGLEFFAFLHTDAYDGETFTAGVKSVEAQQVYLDQLIQKSMHTREIGVTISDRIVLLSTCSASSTNGRDILVAKITERGYADTLKLATSDNPQEITSGAARFGFWDKVPKWLLVIWPVLLLILAAVVIYDKLNLPSKKTSRKKRRSRNKN